MDKLKSIKGKKISSVSYKYTWDNTQVESITLHFEDRSSLEINAHTTSGCEECDPDGSQIQYLSFFQKEPR